MAEDDKKDENELSEDEKLAAEWEAAMEESGEDGADDAATDDDSREDEWAAAMAEAEQEEAGGGGDDVRTAPMEEFSEDGGMNAKGIEQGEGPPPDLDVILDIPVTISMEVGNTQIPIRNLLQLNQGSVIELDRLAGEPLDVLVNGTLIAHGEVVMVNEKFGIRLTDVISPGERIKRLQQG
jgi:flagellar motor switch protein FliN/FliY